MHYFTVYIIQHNHCLIFIYIHGNQTECISQILCNFRLQDPWIKHPNNCDHYICCKNYRVFLMTFIYYFQLNINLFIFCHQKSAWNCPYVTLLMPSQLHYIHWDLNWFSWWADFHKHKPFKEICTRVRKCLLTKHTLC